MKPVPDPFIIVRFLTVGAVNTLFGIGSYWLFLYAGMNFRWAALLSLITGIIFSFNSHRLIVFKTDGGFIRYFLVWLIIYLINIFLLSVCRDYVGDYYAAFAVLPANAALSYLLLKFFVFHRDKIYSHS